ncbi:MAG: GatB/YqeY domain-containing protein [Polyangiaceae bacterium]
MLLDDLKAAMFKAIKANDTVAKEILRVAVGEITTDAARPGKKGDDDETRAILRKLIKSNEETLGTITDPSERTKLERENAVLADYLPKSLDVAAIIAALDPVKDAIKAAANDGQATGVAMKQLKSAGAVVNGKDVSAAVKTIRG